MRGTGQAGERGGGRRRAPAGHDDRPDPEQGAVRKAVGFIEEARAEGTIVAGGEPIPGEGYFISPTIVRDLPDDARLAREE